MAPRPELHELLVTILGSAEHVYFQPPEDVKIVYPCIIYRRDARRTRFADNSPYRGTKRYLVTHISQEPDSTVPEQLAQLPMCTFDRFFTTARLNHDVYQIYF